MPPSHIWNVDPYAVVSFDRYSKTSIVVKESVCPTWNETLWFNDIRLFGDPEALKESPPPVIIELFDQDQVVREASDDYISSVMKKFTSLKNPTT